MTDTAITVGEYYVYCILSFFNAHIFIYMVTKYFNLFKSNIYAIIVLMCHVFHSLEVFWMLELMADFDSSCINHTKCNRCRTSGILDRIVYMIKAIANALMLIKVLEITFQPFPLLAYSKRLIIALKVFVIAFFILISGVVLILRPVEYTVGSVKNDDSKHICHFPANDMQQHHQALFVTIILVGIGTIIMLYSLFIHRTMRLYRFTSNKMIVSNKKKTKKNIKIMVYGIVLPIFRQSVVVSVILIGTILTIMSRRILFLQPFANIVQGSGIILMFSSRKNPWFEQFCGCFEKKLIAKWIQFEMPSLRVQQKSVEMDYKSKKVNIDLVDMNPSPNVNNAVGLQLSPIKENEITLTLQHDPKWSSSLFRNGSNNRNDDDDVSLESITHSDVLAAMMELENTGSSIYNE